MSWVTWEPKSTIRTLLCMDGNVSRTCRESGARGRSGQLFAGFVQRGQAFDLPEPCWEINADVQPWRLAAAAAGQWRSLSSTGPSRGIPEIHLPMRERSDSSGSALSALAGGTGSGIDSGGTG